MNDKNNPYEFMKYTNAIQTYTAPIKDTLNFASSITGNSAFEIAGAGLTVAEYMLPMMQQGTQTFVNNDPHYQHMPDNTVDAVRYSFKTSLFSDDMY